MAISKRLDEKLARIHADPAKSKDFMICDAKDPDMGGGVGYPGPINGADGKPTGRYFSRAQFLQQIRDIVKQDIVDVMLMSVSNAHHLVIEERLFDGSGMTPAIRANDTTDIWGPRGSRYAETPSLPFRTPVIEHAMYGRIDAPAGSPVIGTGLGLYSVTFMNDSEIDTRSLAAFRDFRIEAERKGFRYFLEVFNPNVDARLSDEVGRYVNDCIIRCLAGVPAPARPLFLKMAYNGPRALDELVEHDPHLVPGILGGGAGTTRDCLELVHKAKKHGGRLVLFGRKIRLAEDPLALIALMKKVADEEVTSAEAVRVYHDGLKKAGIPALRAPEKDSEITEAVLKA